MLMKLFLRFLLLAGLFVPPVIAEPKYKAKVPPEIITPDVAKTRLGTLRFKYGVPDDATAKAVFDNLDFMRAVTAFLDGIPIASLYGMCEGLAAAGASG
ncbi:MAG: hypothetical protein ACR2PG_16635, partial [Hyphomicrobiaceae bacterium]